MAASHGDSVACLLYLTERENSVETNEKRGERESRKDDENRTKEAVSYEEVNGNAA